MPSNLGVSDSGKPIKQGTINLSPVKNNSGYIMSYGSPYADVLAGTSTLFNAVALVSYLYVGQSFDGSDWEVDQTFLEFDTRIVRGTLSSATLKVYVITDFSTTDFTIEAYVRDYGTTLTTADWMTPATLSGLTLAASLSTASIGTGLKTLTNSGTVLKDGINTSGKTRIAIASSRNRTSTSASGNEYLVLNGLQDPYDTVANGYYTVLTLVVA